MNSTHEYSEIHIFSFEETCIGIWTDGKPLYRKMVNFGKLPVPNTSKSVDSGVENIDHSHVNIGESFWYSPGVSYSFINTNYIRHIFASGSGIVIETVLSSASNYDATICIEYTKTTDII